MTDLLEGNAAPLTALLPEHVKEQLRAIGTPVSYSDAQLIHSRGDNKPGLSIVESGAVQVGTLGRDGSFLAASTLGPGQSFGEHTLFAGLPRTHDVTALGVTEILQIEAAPLLRLYENEPALARALLVTSLTRSHILLELLDDMRRLNLSERLAKFLLSMAPADRIDDAPIELICLQADLAFALGVSRVSLGKALKKLEAKGHIATGYGRITLTAPARLAAWIDSRRQTAALTST